jgi:hypothetical protein
MTAYSAPTWLFHPSIQGERSPVRGRALQLWEPKIFKVYQTG